MIREGEGRERFWRGGCWRNTDYSKYDYFVSKKWYLPARFFLKDRFKDLKLRSLFGAGLGGAGLGRQEREFIP